MVFSLGYGVYNGAMVAALTEVVPPQVRASCFALAYSLAAALFGTSTPLISRTIIRQTGDRGAPRLLADAGRGGVDRRGPGALQPRCEATARLGEAQPVIPASSPESRRRQP